MLGKRDIIHLLLHYHHQNYSCIKMGSDESHFNVSVGQTGSHVRGQCSTVVCRCHSLRPVDVRGQRSTVVFAN